MMLSIYFALRAFKQSGRRDDWLPTAAAEDGQSVLCCATCHKICHSPQPPFLTCRNYLPFLIIPDSQLW